MTETPRYTVLPRTLILIIKNQQVLLMKYSGKGTHMTAEKEERKDIYNGLGGHVEEDEDVIENAKKEALEEAGINLLNPKVKGIMNVSNFSGKNVMMFIVVGTTEDELTTSTLEGDLEWIPFDKLDKINVFDDVKPFLETITKLKPEEMFLGKAKFDGKFKLLELNYSVY